MMMKASKTHELVTDLPASELWEIIGGLRYLELFHQLLPEVLQKFEVINGDGGVGTVLRGTILPPGETKTLTYLEEFIKIDNENYIKETLGIDGDYQKLGFTRYGARFEVIEKGPSSAVIKSSILYEFDDAHPEIEVSATIAPDALAARAFVKYLKEQTAGGGEAAST